MGVKVITDANDTEEITLGSGLRIDSVAKKLSVDSLGAAIKAPSMNVTASPTQILFSSVHASFDIGAFVGSGILTIPADGIYTLSMLCQIDAVSNYACAFYGINGGSVVELGCGTSGPNSYPRAAGCAVLKLNKNDVIRLYASAMNPQLVDGVVIGIKGP